MISDNEDEKRFQRWAQHIRKNVGAASDRILRYFWDLYDTLLGEIKNNNNQNKNNQNGKI